MRDGRHRHNSARVAVEANGSFKQERLSDDLESSFAEGLKESYSEEATPANQASVALAVAPAVQPTVVAQPAAQPALSAQPAVTPTVATQPEVSSPPATQPAIATQVVQPTVAAVATQPVQPAVVSQPAVEPPTRAQPVVSARRAAPIAAQPAVAVQPTAQPAAQLAAASSLPVAQTSPAAAPPQVVASSIAYTAQQLPATPRVMGPRIVQSLGSVPSQDLIPGQGYTPGPTTYASGSFSSILGIMVTVAIGLLVVFVCVHQYLRRLSGNNQRGAVQGGTFNFGRSDSSRPTLDKRQSFVDRRRSASIKKRRDTNKLGTARAQELLKARVTSALQGKSLEAGESLNQALQTAGIDLTADGRGLQSLEDELRNRKCEVLWVKDPATSRDQLVRFVRLLRVRFAKNTPESDMKELIEVNRIRTRKEDARLPVLQRRTRQEDIDAPLTFKLKLDEMDLMATCQKVLLDRLQLPLDWQEKFLLLEESDTSDTVESYVETQESKNYPGLSTWYLIDEYSFLVDAMTVPQRDVAGLLGLPDSSEFQTTSEDKEEHITYTWAWRLQGAPVNKTKSGHDVNEFNNMRTRGSMAVPASSPRGPRTPSISIPQGRVGETGGYPGGEAAGGNGLFSAPPTPNSRSCSRYLLERQSSQGIID